MNAIMAQQKHMHNVFGHCGLKKLRRLVSKLDKTGKLNVPSSFFCESCQQGKQTRKARKETCTVKASYGKGELLHMDICGPVKPLSLGGSRYILNIMDEHSRFCFSYLLAKKDGPSVMDKIVQTVNLLRNRYKLTVRIVRSDQGSEFTSKELVDWYKMTGIGQELTNTYTPAQNGNIERLDRTLIDITRTWILDSKMPNNL